MPTEHAKRALRAVPAADDADEIPDVCPICFGSGMEIIAGKGARVCACRRQGSHAGNLKKSKIPQRYEGCYITNYAPANPSQIKAVRLAEEFGMKYPAVDSGILYTGSVGVGKTHLAVSILKLLSERGFTCLFYEFG